MIEQAWNITQQILSKATRWCFYDYLHHLVLCNFSLPFTPALKYRWWYPTWEPYSSSFINDSHKHWYNKDQDWACGWTRSALSNIFISNWDCLYLELKRKDYFSFFLFFFLILAVLQESFRLLLRCTGTRREESRWACSPRDWWMTLVSHQLLQDKSVYTQKIDLGWWGGTRTRKLARPRGKNAFAANSISNSRP